jgi:[acyl-carrier-protein] S-malonyltransferase
MKYTFLFPGQGSQKVGMGQDFYNMYEHAKKRFAEADEITGRNLSDICFNGPEEALTATNNTQPALFTVESIISDILNEKGVTPAFVAGHSLGEYGALYASGSVSFCDGLKIVTKRGELMAQAGKKSPGTMAAVIGMPKQKIRECLSGVSGTVVCANENSPDQTVISGELDAVNRASEVLKKAGAKRVILLPVSGAFHSPLMAQTSEEFAGFIAPFTFKDPKCPVIANVTARLETSGEALKNLLIKQLTSTVRWVDSMACLAANDFGSCIEVGPSNVLGGLAKKCDAGLNVISCATVENVYSLVSVA